MKRSERALTLIEVVIVIVLLVILGGFFFILATALNSAKQNSARIGCVSNLKQLGLGLRMWAGEHDDKFPMQVSTNDDGSLEWAGTKDVYRHFMAAGNEIGSPKVVVCPQDIERTPVQYFSNLNNAHLSYFINVAAAESNALQLLNGDRHLTRNGIQYTNGAYLIATQQALTWGLKPHKHYGNLALTDGSVQQAGDRALQSAFAGAGPPTNWLAFP